MSVVISGVLKDYAWGRTNAMAPWTGSGSHGPEAELWFGTHLAGPSPVVTQLGAPVPSSPLLVKLLAAAAPLSIQVHPDARAIAWLREHKLDHLLSDDGLKSEMLVAIEPFDALVGLRSVDSAKQVLSAMGAQFSPGIELLADGNWRALIKWLLAERPSADFESALASLPEIERSIMRKVYSAFAGDEGLPVAFLMQPHRLLPGQAVFVDVGTIHAYVDGFGLEVMVSCDNVMRLGLTSKTIAVDAGLQALDPLATGVFLDGVGGSYSSQTMPFEVQKLSGQQHLRAGSTLVCIEGNAALSGPQGTITLKQGQGFLISDGDEWEINTSGTVWLARGK